ncbi:MAG: hypothetical protein Greene071421_457 [Parcubacteria group bacterium Greene0714_21]|nr:MAG: hypothetical protein Greene041639_110 [Parcubacteria group bacterium Greene0416_39]TSC98221.1 MAG: hypothetical protein Greene101447_184 [Parcubacteria group bacterium Greene1014_47]TSD04091.1 MAG: hypothetical protein Greene071421_457 [Parcubacteria group bacterium Greene0714_21]
MKFTKGFTLIELLVVIAVIGMLASIVLISLGPTRAKARDSKRIVEVRQMGLALEQEAADGAEAITGCVLDQVDASTCTGPGAANFANFKDPSAPATPCPAGAGTATCQYSIATNAGVAGAKTDDYQICFVLEQGVGTITGLSSPGKYQIETGGNFKAGCE